MDVEIKLVTLTSLSDTDLSGEKHGQALETLGRVENLLKQYMETHNRALGFLEEEERKIINEFCHLLEKSKQLFNGLRDMPQVF